MKKTFITILLSTTTAIASAMETGQDSCVWYDGNMPVTFSVETAAEPVVATALEMFSEDMRAVTGKRASRKTAGNSNAAIRIYELDKAGTSLKRKLTANKINVDKLVRLTDGFQLCVINGTVTIVGTNGRGTAYGILEMSRIAGVNPWIWWGDVIPEKKQRLAVASDTNIIQGASVEYRGIFLNDEDWSTRPWSYGTYEPGEFGVIGAKTYKKIFQLLLRLRANAIWPGMHTGTKAFFTIPGTKEAADSCGIAIGTSHCEPLLRNNVDEWNESERGRFNYITNRKQVQNYWIERLQEVRNSAGGNMFTIGMRGIHDGSMEGVKTMDEKFMALQQVIDDQQQLIGKYIGNPEKQMQVFVPYKEVLEIYERGLKVPDYVTLMWCDDNYGYMTRLSDDSEQKRSGGAGVYYHLSYWGRPHDYLWLTTTQPGLIYNEMKAAYDHNARKLWIVNVHDPKVAGYDLELFLDMAWNINCVNANTIDNHYRNWLCRQFGKEAGERIFPAMHEFFRLCGQRKPEFMGWSQTELSKALYDRGLSQVRNTDFSPTAFGGEMDRYMESYAKVCLTVEEAATLIRPELKDAYFSAILYPVLCASSNATKTLEAQRARQIANGSTMKGMFDCQHKLYESVAKSQDAYQQIRTLTDYYNNTMSGGKWRRSMNMRPRDLPSGAAPVLPFLLTDKEVAEYVKNTDKRIKCHKFDAEGTIACDACQWTTATTGAQPVKMLGHSMNAVALPKGGSLTYGFETVTKGDAVLHTALIPTQPNDNGDLRFSVTVDDREPVVFSLKEKFRSDSWKENVLRGQAVKSLKLNGLTSGRHTLKIEALDHHIVVDQWMLDFNPQRKHYLFPVER